MENICLNNNNGLKSEFEIYGLRIETLVFESKVFVIKNKKNRNFYLLDISISKPISVSLDDQILVIGRTIHTSCS
jgi:hypothetical protein